MKMVPVKDVEPGEIFLYQAPNQSLRAWIHLGILPPNAPEYANCVWAESLYHYGHIGDWVPGRKYSGALPSPNNDYPIKYLWLRSHLRVLA